MSNSGKIDVAYVAQLARLELTDEEKARLEGQLGSILAYVDQLRKLSVDNIEPTAHAIPQVNVFRKDLPHAEAGEASKGLTVEEALKNAPQRMNDLFVVPKVVED
jgi:aspartyl-tRNA(Asn)/glutamyl-tRNA(Gln) amidotransferase subunit C